MVIDYSQLEIGEKIGEGAYGTVFKGKWRSGTVALKILLGHLEGQQLLDFRSEASIHKQLRPHTNVVQFLGICFHEDQSIIVTEYLAGGSVHDLLQGSSKMSREMVMKILRQIAAGMFHLTEEGIIHRDLAARNCLLSSNFDVKVSDFGMSRFTKEEVHSSKAETGPLKWMAPESLRSNLYSQKSDVWSFGVVIYEVITRKEPYEDIQSPVAVATRVADNTLRLEAPKMYPDLGLIMDSCMQYETEKRPTFSALCQQLASIE